MFRLFLVLCYQCYDEHPRTALQIFSNFLIIKFLESNCGVKDSSYFKVIYVLPNHPPEKVPTYNSAYIPAKQGHYQAFKSLLRKQAKKCHCGSNSLLLDYW